MMGVSEAAIADAEASGWKIEEVRKPPPDDGQIDHYLWTAPDGTKSQTVYSSFYHITVNGWDPKPGRDIHNPIRVILKDVVTGATVTVDSVSLYQWTDGNWSHDCNRDMYFDYPDDDQDETDDELLDPLADTCTRERYIVIAAEHLEDGEPVDTSEFNLNGGYPADLVQAAMVRREGTPSSL